MKSKLLLVLLAGFAFACSEKAAEKPAPASAPKVAAAPAAEPAKPADATPATAAAPSQAKVAGKGKARDDRCKGTCDVDVTVTSSGSTCTITAPAMGDTVYVAKDAQPTTIKWTITNPATDGFKFAQSPGGIVFGENGKTAPPSGVMQNGAGGAGVATVTDNNANGTGVYPYTIHIEKGAVKCRLDPSVDNE